eukprot:Platyproteum_vivax@DN1667_c0_g1_i1.p1
MPVSYTFTVAGGEKKTVLLDKAGDLLPTTTDTIVSIVPTILLDFMLLPSGLPTLFDAELCDQIPLVSYINRIHDLFQCSNEAYVIALIYMDRIVHTDQLRINKRNIHRMFLTSLMIATKFIDDYYLTNVDYALAGYCTLKCINELERLFLSIIEYKLHVMPSEFVKFRNYLHVARYKIPQFRQSRIHPITEKCTEGNTDVNSLATKEAIPT